jgi:ribonuclease BN (tRNA processing enzyme)
MPRLGFLGHSAVEYAVGLAERCGVSRLVLFHHDPWRTDEEIDRLASECEGAGVPVIAAFDGMVLDLP